MKKKKVGWGEGGGRGTTMFGPERVFCNAR